MVKRAKVTAETFEKKQSAIDKLVGNAPQEEQEPETGAAASLTQEQPAIQRTYKPTSFYLSDSQLYKLDELALEYKKIRGKRINRNDIVRVCQEVCGNSFWSCGKRSANSTVNRLRAGFQ